MDLFFSCLDRFLNFLLEFWLITLALSCIRIGKLTNNWIGLSNIFRLSAFMLETSKAIFIMFLIRWRSLSSIGSGFWLLVVLPDLPHPWCERFISFSDFLVVFFCLGDHRELLRDIISYFRFDVWIIEHVRRFPWKLLLRFFGWRWRISVFISLFVLSMLRCLWYSFGDINRLLRRRRSAVSITSFFPLLVSWFLFLLILIWIDSGRSSHCFCLSDFEALCLRNSRYFFWRWWLLNAIEDLIKTIWEIKSFKIFKQIGFSCLFLNFYTSLSI